MHEVLRFYFDNILSLHPLAAFHCSDEGGCKSFSFIIHMLIHVVKFSSGSVHCCIVKEKFLVANVAKYHQTSL